MNSQNSQLDFQETKNKLNKYLKFNVIDEKYYKTKIFTLAKNIYQTQQQDLDKNERNIIFYQNKKLLDQYSNKIKFFLMLHISNSRENKTINNNKIIRSESKQKTIQIWKKLIFKIKKLKFIKESQEIYSKDSIEINNNNYDLNNDKQNENQNQIDNDKIETKDIDYNKTNHKEINDHLKNNKIQFKNLNQKLIQKLKEIISQIILQKAKQYAAILIQKNFKIYNNNKNQLKMFHNLNTCRQCHLYFSNDQEQQKHKTCKQVCNCCNKHFKKFNQFYNHTATKNLLYNKKYVLDKQEQSNIKVKRDKENFDSENKNEKPNLKKMSSLENILDMYDTYDASSDKVEDFNMIKNKQKDMNIASSHNQIKTLSENYLTFNPQISNNEQFDFNDNIDFNENNSDRILKDFESIKNNELNKQQSDNEQDQETSPFQNRKQSDEDSLYESLNKEYMLMNTQSNKSNYHSIHNSKSRYRSNSDLGSNQFQSPFESENKLTNNKFLTPSSSQTGHGLSPYSCYFKYQSFANRSNKTKSRLDSLIKNLEKSDVDDQVTNINNLDFKKQQITKNQKIHDYQYISDKSNILLLKQRTTISRKLKYANEI